MVIHNKFLNYPSLIHTTLVGAVIPNRPCTTTQHGPLRITDPTMLVSLGRAKSMIPPRFNP